MKKIVSFVKESYHELIHNVYWPSYTVLQKTSILVLIGSIIFAVIVGIIDIVFKSVLDAFYFSF